MATAETIVTVVNVFYSQKCCKFFKRLKKRFYFFFKLKTEKRFYIYDTDVSYKLKVD